jgi:hypothetical protein
MTKQNCNPLHQDFGFTDFSHFIELQIFEKFAL